MPSSRDLPKPGIEPRSPALQADSLPSEPPGKPKNTEWVAYPFSRGSPDTGIKLGSPALQVDSLPAELPGYCPTNMPTLFHLRAFARALPRLE